eukprot:8687221-Ditylum_brightwellii.AAC.1
MERIATFAEKIVEPDFKTVNQLLENYLLKINQGNRMIKPKKFTDMAKSQQGGLNQLVDGDMKVKLHCAEFKGNLGQNQDVSSTLQIPNALFSSFLSEQKE